MSAWQFVLNDQPMSTLVRSDLSVPAFSGLSDNVNRCASACFVNQGPIPPGTYHIVDRPTGGILGGVRDWWSGKSEWFALFADDGSLDDAMLCDEVSRGNFRLHPKGPLGISQGCITVENWNDFQRVRNLLLSETPQPVPGSALTAYGSVTVRCGQE
ncbi:DUF2778 domain-containing protein [Roseomonas terrae]|uniref:DUF2778 domain-containing protein n=1 Tax=Neoroseomonas terrae TaxID=424799 RepID=A0ABS5EFL1_9PROT|nr:DUF2778 domain-containing protein [Neoroseomonas terrae]MBR0649810.1 DUF2778 domain-containing protein [Neoroseomonas terrae]